MQKNNYMKYIKLEQELFINTSLDFTHVCIYSWIKQFSHSKSSLKLANNQDYTWVSYHKIVHDLPILKLKQQSIRKKVNLLKKNKILDTRIVKDKVYIKPIISSLSPAQDNKLIKKITKVVNVNQYEFLNKIQTVKTSLTFKHAIIYYWLKKYIENSQKLKNSKNQKVKMINQKPFFWFSYNKIISELPLLKINNVDRIRVILKELSDEKMIEKYFDKSLKKMFIRIL